MHIDNDELNLTRSDSASENELSSPEASSWGPPTDSTPGSAPSSPEAPSQGPPVSDIPGVVLPPFIVLPSRPTFPSHLNSSIASTRFLHTASNQSAINIQLGNRNVMNDVRFGSFAPYYTNIRNRGTPITVISILHST